MEVFQFSAGVSAEGCAASFGSVQETGEERLSVVLNGFEYQVIADRADADALILFQRLQRMINAYQENHRAELVQFLDARKTGLSPTKTVAVINLSGIKDRFYIPDVTTVQGATQAVEEDEPWWPFGRLLDEQPNPTKFTKFVSTMEEMRDHCGELFHDGWDNDFEPQVYPLHKLIIGIRNFIMEDCLFGSHTNPENRYQRFCTALDDACILLRQGEQSTPYFDLIRKILNEIVIARWMKVSLDGFMNSLLEEVRNEQAKEKGDACLPLEFDFHKFGRELIGLNALVDSAPALLKNGALQLAADQFDGEMQGRDFTGKTNTPGVRSLDTYQSDTGVNQRVVYSRHGSPTSGKRGILGSVQALASNIFAKIGYKVGVTGEAVVPNYEQFLFALAEKGEAAFIAVHQQLDGKTETDRVKGVMALQDTHDNLAVLVQPIGQGDFATKKGPYLKATTFEDLRIAIFKNFFENGDGSPFDRQRCQLPRFVSGDLSYRERVSEIIDFVRGVYFFDEDDFKDPEVWEHFLLIFYTYQREDLMFRFQAFCRKRVVYKTTFCKDFQDRGGKVALTFACVAAMCSGRFDTQEFMREQGVHVTMPPFMIKRIAMLKDKLAIFASLHPRLVRVYEDKARLSAIQGFLFNGTHRIVAHQVDARPNQKASLDVSKLKTWEEMKDRLLLLQSVGKPNALPVPAAALFAEFAHLKGVIIPDQTLVKLNAKPTTLKEVLAGLGEQGPRMHQCLALVTNGVTKLGKDHLRTTLVREPDQLKLSELKDLRFEMIRWGDGQTYTIDMRQDCDYQVMDARFNQEGLAPGARLAKVTTTLRVDFNCATGDFVRDGVFYWRIKEIV